jgi:hypothetical protein
MNRTLIVFALCCSIVAFTVGRVFAQGAGLPADPVADPTATVGILEQLWRSGAVTSTVIVAGYLTLLALQQRVSWFAQGWRVVWVPAVLGGLTLLADTAMRGVTPTASMFVVALMTTVGSAVQRKPPVTQLPSGEVRS